MMRQFVLFTLEEKQFVLDIDLISRVFWAVAVTPVPKAPPELLGAINMQGMVIPVINLRYLLQLPQRDIIETDQMIIVQFGEKQVALWVDDVGKVIQCDEKELKQGKQFFPDMPLLELVIEKDKELFLGYHWDSLILACLEKVEA